MSECKSDCLIKKGGAVLLLPFTVHEGHIQNVPPPSTILSMSINYAPHYLMRYAESIFTPIYI